MLSGYKFIIRTNKLGFTPEFLGRVKLVTSIASLLGVGLYNGFLKTVPLRKIFLVTTIFGSALGMTQVRHLIIRRRTLPSISLFAQPVTLGDCSYVLQVLLVTGFNRQLGISDEWFAIGDSLILTVLAQVDAFCEH